MRISDWSSDVCSSDLLDGTVAVELERVEHGLYQRRRIARPDAARVAGFVVQARIGQRQLDVADVLVAAEGDALVGQHLGAQWLVAAAAGRRRAQRGDGGGWAARRVGKEGVSKGISRWWRGH